MRFHLIDRVDEWEPTKSVRARKVTSFSEDYWEEVDGELRMPPPFVLEAFCQAGTWLIMITTERRKRAALLQVGLGHLAPRRPARRRAGHGGRDELVRRGDRGALGTVTVDGEPVLECEDVMCALIDADDLADPETHGAARRRC